jgi:benzoate membrane transport protein
MIAGIWKPLGRAVAAIPMPLANAMLAGILLHMCVAPISAVVEKPILGLTIVAVWAFMARIKRVYAVPAAFITTIVLIVATGSGAPIEASALLPNPVLIAPVFSFSAFMSVGVPLFIVTMASQNIPGIAVLALNGFKPEPSPLFTVTGLLTLVSAPFGGHAVNLAAITAAMCAGPDAHADPARRYWAGISSGVIYILFGLIAGGATALINFSPPILIEAVAGLALIGAFGASIHSAVSNPNDRDAAIITFLVAASGMSLFGIGGAFWGLLAGGAMMALQRVGRIT